MCMFMPLLVNQKKQLTLLGWGSAFGLTIWVPGGIMPLGGSLTSTSKPASKRQDRLQLSTARQQFTVHSEGLIIFIPMHSSSIIARYLVGVKQLVLVISAFTAWEVTVKAVFLTYLFQCHQWWRGLCRGLQLQESSWRCRFHQCWHESTCSHWVWMGNDQ